MLMNCGKFVDRASSSTGGIVLPALDLDFDSATYGDIHWAYSTRKIVSTYSGPCLRVRRTSDDAEQDIEFGADGWLDEASLLSFCAGTDGYVVTWYNQSSRGSVADVTNATASLQPLIVSSGVLQATTPNGKPTIFFNADRLESSATGWQAPNDSMRYMVTKCRSTPVYHWLRVVTSSAGQCDWQFRGNSSIIRQYYYNGAHDFVQATLLDDWKVMGACKLYGTGNSTSLQRVNGANSTGSTGSKDPTTVVIGQHSSNYPGVNDISELFCFTGEDHTHDYMAEFETFMNDAFGIL